MTQKNIIYAIILCDILMNTSFCFIVKVRDDREMVEAVDLDDPHNKMMVFKDCSEKLGVKRDDDADQLDDFARIKRMNPGLNLTNITDTEKEDEILERKVH